MGKLRRLRSRRAARLRLALYCRRDLRRDFDRVDHSRPPLRTTLVSRARPSHLNCMEQWHGTTILGVKKGGKTVIAGDGQVSMGNTVMKPNAKKVRRIGDGKVIGGFAG